MESPARTTIFEPQPARQAPRVSSRTPSRGAGPRSHGGLAAWRAFHRHAVLAFPGMENGTPRHPDRADHEKSHRDHPARHGAASLAGPRHPGAPPVHPCDPDYRATPTTDRTRRVGVCCPRPARTAGAREIIGCRTGRERPAPPPRNPYRWIPDRHRLSPATARRPDRSGAPAPVSPSDAAGVPSAAGVSPVPTDPTGGPVHPGVAATGVRTSRVAGIPRDADNRAMSKGSRAASLRRPHRIPARPETTVPSGTRSTHR